jgi:hypothetical protein
MPTNLMDGKEDTLFENTLLGSYTGYVFLDQMKAGDTILFTAYIYDVEGKTYQIREQKQLADGQTYKVLEIRELIAKQGFKITATQTAGTMRTLNSIWFKR